ncbi:hypothetical protein [Caulobacter sp. BK020]|uniref:hypothetical protein n=1 Tax=Caulobacter sp. BK020 TaxID=2512117 RepID=UPI00105106FC|nr:hypothetical protein [Caulobacter sp. BK020]TCS10232.1 hypothetical protein EV278_11989 [Caulobacter sp. BK020]
MARILNAHAPRSSLAALAIAAAGLLAACGQGSSSTSVVLTGPPHKVEALIAQYKLYDPPVQAHLEKLADGRERAAFTKPVGLSAVELIDLGKEAAKTGVAFEFSSGTKWGSGASADASVKAAPAPASKPAPSAV